MPKAAPKPCSHPGCHVLVVTGKCSAHVNAQRAEVDRRRGSPTARGYDAHWRRFRLWFLGLHPLCVMCTAEGRVVAAEVVDHIVSIRDRPDLRLDPSNCRALCKRHHDQRTATEQGFAQHRTPR